MYGESIYALIPPPDPVVEKPTMHRSMYPGKVDPRDFSMGVAKLSQHSTFGPPKEQNRTLPDGYLKKRTGEPELPEPKATTKAKSKIKSDVPMRTEKPIMGLVSDKNFVTANAVEVILSKPKQNSANSEESMKYTKKSDYGKVPQYLSTIKTKIADEKAKIDEHIRMQQEAEMAQNQRLSKLSEEERTELLAGLKLKWAEVNEKYQKMTFTLDTPAKRQRKERYEEQLMQFEKDIDILSRKNIYVEHNSYHDY